MTDPADERHWRERIEEIIPPAFADEAQMRAATRNVALTVATIYDELRSAGVPEGLVWHLSTDAFRYFLTGGAFYYGGRRPDAEEGGA